MKYIVERASACGCGQENQPCEGCTFEEVVTTETLFASKLEDVPRYKNNPNEWFEEKGYFNHRLDNGNLKRDRYVKRWTITFETLEDLHAFIKKEGQVIIYDEGFIGNELPTLTIYDDYVE